jgi:dihydroorotase
MKSLFIRGARLMDPLQGIDATGSLLIEDGVIAWLGVGEAAAPDAADVLDAAGLVACPGFVDLHCHLREPGDEHKETIRTGTQAAARGGFTTVCCMPNTRPPLDSREAVERVRETAVRDAVVRVLPIGCVTTGRQGRELADMAELVAAGAVAFSDDGDAVADADLMRRALEWGQVLGTPIMDHCEDKDLSSGGLVNEGVSGRLGVRGIPTTAEEAVVSRDVEIARAAGAAVHIAHVSTAGSVELIRQAKRDGVPVTAEVTPHHLTLTEEEVLTSGPNAKVNPPLRTARDVEALVGGLADGTIDAIATDHAPHATGEKQRGLTEAPFGISVFETAFGGLMALVHEGKLPLYTVLAGLTSGPAAILGGRYGRLGALAVDEPADIVIFEPDLEWTVDTEAFASKGRNTPLAGRTLKGRVLATVAGGRLVHNEMAIRAGAPGPGGR